ncbi:MAG: HAD-IB family hydrolase, partial [Phycicoccus sp.]
MSGAAIFDLDRTLLQGGTGPLLSRAMYDLGVVTRRLPGERYLYGLFDLLGETLPSIALARQATLVAKGRGMTAFDAAAERAAAWIAEVVHPFALTLMEQHRAAGRPVVLATTTPHHLISPLADRLGVDHVIATRYSIGEDGTFDGGLAGRFVWSRGKLAAVSEWADTEGVDLAESFAYSDSIYDLPLLTAVGHPAAVNPDPRLAVYAVARGWPIVHFDVSPGVVKLPVVGVELQRLLLLASPPQSLPYARVEVDGVEHIPRTGPAILAGNHRSYFDISALIQLMRRTDRTARILAKRELFDIPGFGALATALGAIPVDRAGGGAESLEAAAVALEGGEIVCVLPQGTIP